MREFKVDEEMAQEVQKYLDKIRQYAAGNMMLVEQRLEFSEYVDVPEQFGTSDTVILTDDEIQVHDLKYGRGVRVDAEENEQLMLYALGALATFGLLSDFKRVRLVIHQPRLDHLSEWDCTIEHLLAFADRAKAAAATAISCLSTFEIAPRVTLERLIPGEKQCRWCKAKAKCPAIAREVSKAVFDEFEILGDPKASPVPVAPPNSPDRLGVLMSRLELIEDWCRAIRAQVESNLGSGLPVAGWKLVEGKRGNRAWSNEDEAIAALKKAKLKHDEMFSYKIISPTQAAKKLEKAKPRVWKKLNALISQSDGKPSVAPESDKRPAIKSATTDDYFKPISNEGES